MKNKRVMICTGGGGTAEQAFTMAEILLSLTIIGVVAAITLPSLTGNINERTWNTQRKALYARFSQAIALMPALNGYGTYSGTNTDGVVTATEDTAAETFVTNGLAKVLKINNICDAAHLSDCGIPDKYNPLLGGAAVEFPTKLSELNSAFTGPVLSEGVTYQNPQKNIDTKAAAFETANGESIAVFYNPSCQSYMQEHGTFYSQPKMCANFIYDLNGKKGPNTVGKDIGFITALYPTDTMVVAPIPLTQNASTERVSQPSGGALCKQQDSESRMPNHEELSALFYNKQLVGMNNVGEFCFWSSSTISSEFAYNIGFKEGRFNEQLRDFGCFIRCIRR